MPFNQSYKWRDSVQILDVAACVSYHPNAFGKGMNPSVPTSYG